jgi:hypothetical protein
MQTGRRGTQIILSARLFKIRLGLLDFVLGLSDLGRRGV